jgi:glutamine amidotransferase
MKITIIDYGLSNLLSVSRAVEMLGYESYITNTVSDVLSAEKILLPGVGAFRDGMRGLDKLNLVDAIREKAESGTNILGICLGMQMLFDESDEFGVSKGLSLIPGRVEKIPYGTIDNNKQNVPHISWNGLYPTEPSLGEFNSPILYDIKSGGETYFIHSYEAKPASRANVLAETYYGGRAVCAVTGFGNVYGTQFHPEKSGGVGLRILENFLTL